MSLNNLFAPTNNREVWAHSMHTNDMTVVNVNGSPYTPGGATGPTGPNPLSNTNPWYYVPAGPSGFTGINNEPYTLASPPRTFTVGDTGLTDGSTGFDVGTYTVTLDNNTMWYCMPDYQIKVIDVNGNMLACGVKTSDIAVYNGITPIEFAEQLQHESNASNLGANIASPDLSSSIYPLSTANNKVSYGFSIQTNSGFGQGVTGPYQCTVRGLFNVPSIDSINSIDFP
jgi:hypothetical protein